MTTQDTEGRDEELLAMLRRHEGEVRSEDGRHVAYDDDTQLPIRPGTHVSGSPTIGWGILLSGAGGIDDEEAEYLLWRRVAAKRDVLNREIPWWREQPRKVRLGLLDMAYNLGAYGLLSFSRMLAHLRTAGNALDGDDHETARQEYELAAKEALDSRWAQQVGQRAETIAQLFRSAAD